MTTPGSPADKIEPKFKVGDWIVTNNGEPQVFRVEKRGWPDSIISGSFGNEYINTFTLDKRHHLWTIQDAKDGDVLAAKVGKESNDFIYIFKDGFWSHCYLDAYTNEFHKGIYHRNYNVIVPATKEQCDLLFNKMKEAGYEWDAEKKELNKIEQEQNELPNGKDYGIDGLYHAVRILEKTLGEVEGYQSDDGILEHKCAIEAVKRLYNQKPDWSKEDERVFTLCVLSVKTRYNDGLLTHHEYELASLWLETIKERMKGE